MAFLDKIIIDPSVPAHIKDSALMHMKSDPGLPSPNPTSSLWMSHLHDSFTPSSVNTQPLLESTDYVIIGSGITGTAVTRQLLRNASSTGRVVVLDARDICGGATGRNGGHINEVGFGDYRELKTIFGPEKAKKILRFRLGHLGRLLKVAEEEGVVERSQIRRVRTVTVFFDALAWEDAKSAGHELKDDLGQEVSEWEISEDSKMLKSLGVETAKGVITCPAGAVRPYRLITSILSTLQNSFPAAFRVHAYTPVASITAVSDSKHKYRVETPRGTILARHIIHCTNAHMGHLAPGLRNRILPVRGQMSAQTPPPSFPRQGEHRSWSMNYSVGFDYLSQLPDPVGHGENVKHSKASLSGGEMMLGDGMMQAEYKSVEDLGVAGDELLNESITKHLSSALTTCFSSACGASFGLKGLWAGSMGFSVDSTPWVGKVPLSAMCRVVANDGNGIGHEKPVEREDLGLEWVSTGYMGEGIVIAWGCGKAVVLMVLGREKEAESWFLEEYLCSEERIKTNSVNSFLSARINRIIDIQGIKSHSDGHCSGK